MDNKELNQIQEQLFRQQDTELDKLLVTVQRQRAMAQQICDEISLQNNIIDHLDNHIETSTKKLESNQKQIERVVPTKKRWCSIM